MFESDLSRVFSKLATDLTGTPPTPENPYATINTEGPNVRLTITPEHAAKDTGATNSFALDQLLSAFWRSRVQGFDFTDQSLSITLPANDDSLSLLGRVHAELLTARTLTTLDQAFGPGSGPYKTPDETVSRLIGSIKAQADRVEPDFRDLYLGHVSHRVDTLLTRSTEEASLQQQGEDDMEYDLEGIEGSMPRTPTPLESMLAKLSGAVVSL